MRFERLDLNLLVALDSLLETQSVTETASRLHLSQPSVSAALARLRDYFADDLLVLVGRKMLPTAKAEELAPAIKDMLNLVRFRIIHADDYDPAQSRRRFRIVASDYAFDVLMSKVLAKAEKLSPYATFDLSSPSLQKSRQFIDGEIDVMVVIENYMTADHPSELLYTDEDAVICWNAGIYASGISTAQFLQARHVVAVFGQEQLPTVTELHFDASGIDRHVAIRVPSFAAIPGAVIGTNRIATMHKRQAELFSAIYPIQMHSLPIKGPGIREVMQWHKLRHNDAGLRWILSLIRAEAEHL